MKKQILFTLLSLSAFAYQNVDDRLDHLETQMMEVSARNPNETLGASFVTSRPEVKDGTNFFLTLDVIYWHPKVGGTEFAYTANGGFSGGFSTGTRAPKGEIKENDFSWDIGLKAGIGYHTGRDRWDLYARYTWFDSFDTKSVQKNAPAYILPLNALVAFAGDRVKSRVDIKYNNVELELARSYFLSKYYSIRPHFDIKSTWLDIDEALTLHISPSFVAPIANDYDYKVKASSRFWGVGPRAGVDAKLFIGDRFNLFGEIAGSILYGHFKTRHKDIFPTVVGASSELAGTLFSIEDHFHQFVPFVQMLMGLEWGSYLNQHRQHIALKLGYEVQYYWRVFQSNRVHEFVSDFVTNPPPQIAGTRNRFDKISEDVMFYGITGEVRLDF